ncbi:MAG TPA: cupin domain-containing protein [Longimicrobium sp.]|nr:cupin domain-containing protein [Longimicrobium sp.]
MQIQRLRFDGGFAVAFGNGRAQAATMVIAPGGAEGGPGNRHRGADQWLYVVAGQGAAVVEGETHVLRPGVILLIERGEAHEIRNTGPEPLQTLNFYAPPAYTQDGDTLPAGEGE